MLFSAWACHVTPPFHIRLGAGRQRAGGTATRPTFTPTPSVFAFRFFHSFLPACGKPLTEMVGGTSSEGAGAARACCRMSGLGMGVWRRATGSSGRLHGCAVLCCRSWAAISGGIDGICTGHLVRLLQTWQELLHSGGCCLRASGLAPRAAAVPPGGSPWGAWATPRRCRCTRYHCNVFADTLNGV